MAEPRTSFLYNNLFFVLLGHIAELMEGRTWEELVQTEVFDKVKESSQYLKNYLPVDWLK